MSKYCPKCKAEMTWMRESMFTKTHICHNCGYSERRGLFFTYYNPVAVVIAKVQGNPIHFVVTDNETFDTIKAMYGNVEILEEWKKL